MTLETVGFWVVAVVLLASSLAVVLTPNLFHAVLYLAAALVATGVIFLLLDQPFLFAVQLLLYAGGVVTIVVFAIMLTERLVGERIRQTSRHLVNGAIVAAAVFAGVAGFLLQAPLTTVRPQPAADATVAIGRALVGPFAVTLLLLGVLTRRNAVGILLGIELMLNAVNINLVAFARFNGDLTGLIFTLFTISITVAEIAVGLAIVIAIFRVRRTVEADRLDLLRG